MTFVHICLICEKSGGSPDFSLSLNYSAILLSLGRIPFVLSAGRWGKSVLTQVTSATLN